MHKALHPLAALEMWAYTTALQCSGRCLHPACPSTRCRDSCVQIVDFQHASFSCKPTSAPHKLQTAFAGMLAGLWGERLMLHQALPVSPSGAGLEDIFAMQGDASQLQRAALCSPSEKE